ncbi:MAG: PBP1A family penicillin-binding protein [Treponema sp.]|nr:PBP1A family penicillin-binding protein [Treponema sp.]
MSSWSSSIVLGIFIRLMAVMMVILALIIGAGLGLSMAETANIRNQENFFDFAPALPTRILDVNGILITEFSADEKRALVSLNDLPRHLIHAVLVREDPDFFTHKGFSVRGIARAVWGQLSGQNLGGGSTITQQIAGTLYTDRRELTMRRKAEELWWAFQMERRFTKNEILELYLNQINTGPGVFGVEAASQYFFGKGVTDISLAESALLVILFSSPSRYNPLNNPNVAMTRQRIVLDRMIEAGYTTPEEAELSFNEYWDNYDFTRASIAAYFDRPDLAPWFSEYVRRELDDMMYGTMDYYRDGFTVHTTLNMRHQEAADLLMQEGINRANVEYLRTTSTRLVEAERTWLPIVDLLSLAFDLDQIHSASDAQDQQRALSRYTRVLNPVVDMAALVFGLSDLKPITIQGFAELRTTSERNIVEGTLISIENDTGYITAIVGGSRFDESNQFIRATQGNLQPGSAFKPLYYSAAIDSRQFTAATQISDLPIVFHNEDGTPYIPLNFMGLWHGSVLLYDAMAQSMNVASIRVLDGVGFDAAIDRASVLLGYSNPDDIRRRFPRVYPLGLGITSTSPLRMAQAFAVFANQGREVTPIAIRSLEDRNGRVIIDNERELRLEQRRQGNELQLISPQNAFVMTSILRRTLELGPMGHGTLYNPSGWGAKFTFRDENGRNFRMPMAGKTGTTQNWADAWTVGYSPYYTTAVWFGFDRPGNSLGLTLTGSTLAGPIWADYMREIHMGLPFRDFVRPTSGLVDATVCAVSGLLMSSSCNQGSVTLTFLEGTQPVRSCDYHGNNQARQTTIRNIELDSLFIDSRDFLQGLNMPVIRDETLLYDIPYQSPPASRTQSAPAPRAGAQSLLPQPGFNYLLDEGPVLNLPPQISEPVLPPLDVQDSPEDQLPPPQFNPFLD